MVRCAGVMLMAILFHSPRTEARQRRVSFAGGLTVNSYVLFFILEARQQLVQLLGHTLYRLGRFLRLHNPSGPATGRLSHGGDALADGRPAFRGLCEIAGNLVGGEALLFDSVRDLVLNVADLSNHHTDFPDCGDRSAGVRLDALDLAADVLG